ncbi:hypothetical protein DFJ77DRAFT_210088 [Powellomyces hirtus]|nr:hypothetical protein DFJ77DRAFT_210088 [Powellomyces hirtus]
MAFNVFRLTVLFTLAFAGYYFLSDDPRLAERYRRAVIAATGGSGICTISTRNGDSSAYQPQYTLIYNTPVDRASAVALCAAHGQVLARVTSPAGQPPFSSIVKQFCPDAPAALQGQSTWIASWNGDDYQGACLAVTGGTGPNVPIAVNVVPCEQKNYVLCSDAEQKGQSGFGK